MRALEPLLFPPSWLLRRMSLRTPPLLLAVLALALFLAVLAPWVVTLLFGEVFAGSVLPLRLLLPGIVLNCAFKLLAQLVALHRLGRGAIRNAVKQNYQTVTVCLQGL